MSLEDSVFDLLDAHVKRCVEESVPEPETVLARTYRQFGNALKQRVGTSSGFTGLSAYSDEVVHEFRACRPPVGAKRR
jgi:hypothetical protein